jgi:hypothetical protein
MNEKDTFVTLSEGPAPAGWLDEALRIYREVSLLEGDAFAEPEPASGPRFREAAATAWALARLRRERQRTGFVPLGIGGYLKTLARAARIDLGPVLAACGVGDPASQDPAAVRPLARLCRSLDMSVRETFVQLGLGLAEQLGVMPAPVWAARARGPAAPHDSLAESEQALRRALARDDDATVKVHALESEVLAVFEE